MKKKFKREYLVDELDLPLEAEESRVLGESGRWTNRVEIIFRTPDQLSEDESPWVCYDGLAWRTTYNTGKSEMQDDVRPWQYEDEVECELVRRKVVTTIQWVGTNDE